MSTYLIETFNGVALPTYNAEQELGVGAVAAQLVATAGGAVDMAGGARRLPVSLQVQLSGRYVGAEQAFIISHVGDYVVDTAGNNVIGHDQAADLRVQVEALRGQIGAVGWLVRRRWDGVQQQRQARLLDVRERYDTRHRTVMAELDCIFETAGAGWQAMTSGTLNLLTDVVATARGNLPVRDAVLTITASSTITSVRLQCTERGVDWTWTGNLSAGQTLTVDDGAKTVKIGSIDAYSGFILNSGHINAHWLELLPGLQHYRLTLTGTASAATLTWYDRHA